MFHVIACALLAEGAKFAVYGDSRGRRSGDVFAHATSKNANHYKQLSFGFTRILNSEESPVAGSENDGTRLVSLTRKGHDDRADLSSIAAPPLSANPTERSLSSRLTLPVNNRSIPDVQTTNNETPPPTSVVTTTSLETREDSSQLPGRVVAAKNDTAQHDRRRTDTQLPSSSLPEVETTTTRSVTSTTVAMSSTQSQKTLSPSLPTASSVSQPVVTVSSVAPPTLTTKKQDLKTAPPLEATTTPPQTFIKLTSTASRGSTQTEQSEVYTSTMRGDTRSDVLSTYPTTTHAKTVPTVQSEIHTSTMRVYTRSTTMTTSRTTKRTKSEASVELPSPVPPVTSTPHSGIATDRVLTLTDERKHEVIFQPNQGDIIVEPVWARGTGGESRSQLALKIILSPTQSQRFLMRSRVASANDIQVEELLLCGGLNSRAYVFDSDPRKNKFIKPQYSSATVSSTERQICVNGIRILVPSSSYQRETYVVLSSNLPSSNSALSATAFLRKNRYPRQPWNVRLLRESIPLTTPSVATEMTSVFLLSSAPWTRHEELRNTKIDEFKSSVMDPFCDQTGTTMASTIAGDSLGIADRVRLIPIPIGGCDPAKGDLRALLSALEEAAKRLAEPGITASKAVVVLQDSETLQNGFGERSLQAALSRIAQVGALAVIPVSKCSSLSGMEGRFLSVGSFGSDESYPEALQIDNLVLSKNLSACASSVDLVAPGLGVTGAATFGSLARREVTDTSAAAAAAVGWLLATSISVPKKLFHVKHVRTATRFLPSHKFRNHISGPENVVRVIGYGSRSQYLPFEAALRDENLSAVSSDDSVRDRIISSISNPTFYGITAGIVVVCVAAAAGIGILAARRGNDNDSTSSAETSDVPPSPTADQDLEQGLEEHGKSASAPLPQERPNRADVSALFEVTPPPQTPTPGDRKEVVNDSAKDSAQNSADRPSRVVEPLRIPGSTSLARQSGPDLGSSSSVQRKVAKSESASARRQNVKTRLSTLTKPQKPAASPGASKASWFATPKASVTPVSEFVVEENKKPEPKDRDGGSGTANGASPET